MDLARAVLALGPAHHEQPRGHLPHRAAHGDGLALLRPCEERADPVSRQRGRARRGQRAFLHDRPGQHDRRAHGLGRHPRGVRARRERRCSRRTSSASPASSGCSGRHCSARGPASSSTASRSSSRRCSSGGSTSRARPPAGAEGKFDLSLVGKDVRESLVFMREHRELRALLVTIFLAIVGGGVVVTVGLVYIQTVLVGTIPILGRIPAIRTLTATPQTLFLLLLAVGMGTAAVDRPAPRAQVCRCSSSSSAASRPSARACSSSRSRPSTGWPRSSRCWPARASRP